MVIFDWDDTLFPSSYLKQKGVFPPAICPTELKNKLQHLESLVIVILTKALEYGDVYIITNSEKGWVELTAKVCCLYWHVYEWGIKSAWHV